MYKIFCVAFADGGRDTQEADDWTINGEWCLQVMESNLALDKFDLLAIVDKFDANEFCLLLNW
jgi:hypothetical protein